MLEPRAKHSAREAPLAHCSRSSYIVVTHPPVLVAVLEPTVPEDQQGRHPFSIRETVFSESKKFTSNIIMMATCTCLMQMPQSKQL